MMEDSVDEHINLQFQMDLIAVEDLGLDGILNLTLNMTITWSDDRIRWDEKRSGCRHTSDSCKKFNERTMRFGCPLFFS